MALMHEYFCIFLDGLLELEEIVQIILPETLEQADPMPWRALATNRTV